MPGGLEPGEGHQGAEDILQANPTGLDFIWAASNEMGLGAMLASESAGRLQLATAPHALGGKQVAVFTNDVTPESVARIGEGKIDRRDHPRLSRTGAGSGRSSPFGWPAGLEVPKTFDIRPRIAYKANATLFYPNPALPAIDWEDIKKNSK